MDRKIAEKKIHKAKEELDAWAAGGSVFNVDKVLDVIDGQNAKIMQVSRKYQLQAGTTEIPKWWGLAMAMKHQLCQAQNVNYIFVQAPKQSLCDNCGRHSV